MEESKLYDLTNEQLSWISKTADSLPEDLRDGNISSQSMYVYNDKVYIIFFRRDLSNFDYTKHKVYDVLTQEEKWGKCMKGIAECLEDTSISIGEYKALNHAQPSMSNYMKKHHKMENVEGTDVMRYTIIEPYDD